MQDELAVRELHTCLYSISFICCCITKLNGLKQLLLLILLRNMQFDQSSACMAYLCSTSIAQSGSPGDGRIHFQDGSLKWEESWCWLLPGSSAGFIDLQLVPCIMGLCRMLKLFYSMVQKYLSQEDKIDKPGIFRIYPWKSYSINFYCVLFVEAVTQVYLGSRRRKTDHTSQWKKSQGHIEETTCMVGNIAADTCEKYNVLHTGVQI